MKALVQALLFVGFTFAFIFLVLSAFIFAKNEGFEIGLALATDFICKESSDPDCKKLTREQLIEFYKREA